MIVPENHALLPKAYDHATLIQTAQSPRPLRLIASITISKTNSAVPNIMMDARRLAQVYMKQEFQKFTKRYVNALAVLAGVAVAASVLLYSGCGMTGSPNTPANPVDTTPPTSTITSPTAGAIAPVKTDITITGASGDTGGGIVRLIEVSLDGGATWNPATGTNPWTYIWKPAVSGPVTIKSRAIDSAGNQQNPPAEVTFTVRDTTPPASTITSPKAGATVPTYTRIHVTGTANSDIGRSVSKVEVSDDGGATWSTATGTTDWSIDRIFIKPGQVTINSRAIDDNGNQQTTTTAVTITAQDVEPPTSAITSPKAGAVGVPVNITGTASDAGGGTVQSVQVSVDDGATWKVATGTTAWSYNWTPTTLGPATIKSRAVDNSGNQQNPPAEITVTVRLPIRVPSEQPTVQLAIDVATDGDTVLVAPGTYFENIDFKGKAITVTSESGAEVTFIDGRNEGSVVSFISGEGRDSSLNGFTVQNGNVYSGSFAGGGIVVRNSSPTITNNRIMNNRAVNDGGGIVVQNSSPTITNNMITNNNACRGSGIGVFGGSPLIQQNTITNNFNDLCVGGSGGGIFIQGQGSAEILDNIISNNRTGAGGGINLENAEAPIIKGNIIKGNIAESQGITPGGGIYVSGSKVLIVQNVVTGNTSGYGAGVYLSIFNSAMVVNNTIVDNNAVAVSGFNTDGSGVFIENGGGVIELTNNIIIAKPGQTAYKCSAFYPPPTPITRFNNVFSPGGPAYGGTCSDMTRTNGNISADPLFADPTRGDYHLQMGSPSIDKGDNQAQNLPDWDLDGKTRIRDGDGDGTSTIDMGVYEFAAPPGLEIGLLDQSKDNSANGRNPFICNLRPWTRSIRPKNSLSSLPASSLRLRGAR